MDQHQDQGLPVEITRLLAFLAWSSFFTPLLVGRQSVALFITQTLIAVPLFLPIDATRLRGLVVWKFVSAAALLVFILVWKFTYRRELAVFILILFCLTYEYYGERRDRAPIRLIGMLSFLVVLSQFRFENGMWLAAGTLIYVLALTFVLLNLHLGEMHRFNFRALVINRFPSAFRHTCLITILTVVIFWSLPRLPHHSYGVIPSVTGQSIRAFSSRVMLNDIGTLRLSSKHVLNVTPLTDRYVANPYLKGKTLDLFEIDESGNAGWSLSSDANNMKFSHNGSYKFLKADPDGMMHAAQLDVKPLIGNTVFFFNELVRIDTKLKDIHMAYDYGGLHFPQMLPSSLTYTVHYGSQPLLGDLPHREIYLQSLPSQDYLDSILAELGWSPELSELEVIALLMQHFKQSFSYSLEINNFGQQDPIRHFLLERPEGHCELFASSMVLLLRRAHIPSRLVTGFLMPPIEEGSSFYYVTESSAHAWVEAFFDGYWHTIDPTPPSQAVPPGFFEYRLALLEHYWNTMILNWDYAEQKKAYQELGALMSRTFDNLWSHRMTIFWILLIGTVLSSVIIGTKIRGRRQNRLWERRFEQLQRRYWRVRRGSETWRRYLESAPFSVEAKQRFASFLDQFHAATYGSNSQVALKDAWKSLELQLKNDLKGETS